MLDLANHFCQDSRAVVLNTNPFNNNLNLGLLTVLKATYMSNSKNKYLRQYPMEFPLKISPVPQLGSYPV